MASAFRVFILLAVFLFVDARRADAQAVVVSPVYVAPVVTRSYYYPPPVISAYAPSSVSYYAGPVATYPAPAVSYYAPAVSYYAPAVSYYAPAVSYYAPTYAPAATTYYRYGLLGRRVAATTYYYP